MSHGWALVGRAEELDFGIAALDGPGIVITGGAGVGKTRLGSELLTCAQDRGATAERILCTSATADIPLGALAPLLPPLTTRPADPLGASYRLELLSALRQGIRDRVGTGRIVLGVDDAHRLDDTGAAAILQLVVAGEVTIVATVRTGETVPEPIRSLWRDAGCDRLELQNLARDEVHHLLEDVVGGAVAPATADRLWKLTRGNPLYLHEVVTAAVDHGTLAETHGVWVWSGTLDANAALRELVADRLERLDDAERSGVALVAAGEPLPLDLLALAIHDDTLLRLESLGLISVTRQRDGTVTASLGHPLYGEVLRSSDPQTAAAHRQLVSLVGDDPRPTLCLPAALWALSSNAPLPAPVFMVAFEQARMRGDDDLACRLAEAAERAGGGEAAAVARGRAMVDADNCDARDVLEPILHADEQSVRATAVTSLADLYRYVLHEPTEALAVFERAGGFDEPWDSYVAAHRATIMSYSGYLREAAAIAVPLLDDPDPRVRVRAIVPAGMALALGGMSQTALERVDAMMGDAFSLGEQLPPATAWWVGARLLALLALGDHDDLTAMMDAVHAQSPDDTGTFLAHFALLEGRSLLIHGRPTSAAAKLRDAATHRQPGGDEEQVWAASLLAEALALLGDAEGASAAWEQVDIGHARQAVFYPDMLRAQAWVSAAQGRMDEARDQVLHAIEVAAATGTATTEMTALQDAARLGAPLDSVARRAAELATWMEGPMPAAMCVHVQAVAAGTADALSLASDQLERAGMTLCAAECALAAGDSPRARMLAARCEEAQTPALMRTVVDPLTPREREVALLAARGLTSRQVADRLHLSARTVDNHLARIYAKLDVPSREHLGKALAVVE